LAVTRGGKKVLAVMTWDDYEAMEETLEILSDKDAMASIRRGKRQAQSGKLLSAESVRRSLGL
jgi:PHD/YefM family antitoxin component YafN of YafNO toxin-antitoxin module